MNIIETKNYVLKHGILLPNNQVFLTKPLLAFKKVCTHKELNDAVFKKTNSIPLHAFAYTLDSAKKTASKAFRYNYVSIPAVANLIIPRGAIVNLPFTNQLKMRATQAYCHSIFGTGATNEEFVVAFSEYDNSFRYYSGKRVGLDTVGVPHEDFVADIEKYFFHGHQGAIFKYCKAAVKDFDTGVSECEAGIHFFAEAQLAVAY
jgi:hypothetical protein